MRTSTGSEYLDFFGGILTVSRRPRRTSTSTRRSSRRSHACRTSRRCTRSRRRSSSSPSALIQHHARQGLAEGVLHVVGHRGRRDRGRARPGLHRRRPRSIALRHGYRGRSMLAQSLTAHSKYRAAADAGARHQARAGAVLLSLPVRRDVSELRRRVREGHRGADPHDDRGRIAGFLAEPIQGVGGFITPPKEYFQIAVGIVRKYGGLFICDEVQTGFGRTGGSVGHRALRRRARHHDDGQGHRERPADRRDARARPRSPRR